MGIAKRTETEGGCRPDATTSGTFELEPHFWSMDVLKLANKRKLAHDWSNFCSQIAHRVNHVNGSAANGDPSVLALSNPPL
jgi:hypothetical protein